MLRVHRDDAGGDARQHGLHERAAGIELRIGGAQRIRLLFKTARHPIEGRRQRLHFVFGLGRPAPAQKNRRPRFGRRR